MSLVRRARAPPPRARGRAAPPRGRARGSARRRGRRRSRGRPRPTPHQRRASPASRRRSATKTRCIMCQSCGSRRDAAVNASATCLRHRGARPPRPSRRRTGSWNSDLHVAAARTRSVIGTSAAPVSRASSAGPRRHPGRLPAQRHVHAAPATGPGRRAAARSRPSRRPLLERAAAVALAAAERQDLACRAPRGTRRTRRTAARARAARRPSSAASRSRRPRRPPSPSCPVRQRARPRRAPRRTAPQPLLVDRAGAARRGRRRPGRQPERLAPVAQVRAHRRRGVSSSQLAGVEVRADACAGSPAAAARRGRRGGRRGRRPRRTARGPRLRQPAAPPASRRRTGATACPDGRGGTRRPRLQPPGASAPGHQPRPASLAARTDEDALDDGDRAGDARAAPSVTGIAHRPSRRRRAGRRCPPARSRRGSTTSRSARSAMPHLGLHAERLRRGPGRRRSPTHHQAVDRERGEQVVVAGPDVVHRQPAEDRGVPDPVQRRVEERAPARRRAATAGPSRRRSGRRRRTR